MADRQAQAPVLDLDLGAGFVGDRLGVKTQLDLGLTLGVASRQAENRLFQGGSRL